VGHKGDIPVEFCFFVIFMLLPLLLCLGSVLLFNHGINQFAFLFLLIHFFLRLEKIDPCAFTESKLISRLEGHMHSWWNLVFVELCAMTAVEVVDETLSAAFELYDSMVPRKGLW
jgi:hypothetical protein